MEKRDIIRIISIILVSLILASCGQKEEQEITTDSLLVDIEKETELLDDKAPVQKDEFEIDDSDISSVRKVVEYYEGDWWKQKVTFTLTIIDNKFSWVEAKAISKNHYITNYTKKFNNWVKKLVEGKTLKEVENIKVVNWASMTTEAFKKALNKLELWESMK